MATQELQPGRPVTREITSVVPYERRLSENLRWALSESSKFFEGTDAVNRALRKVTTRLRELNIPYAVVGGLALFRHGYRRYTEDVDILVGKDAIGPIHEQLEGLGYVAPFAGSKHLRDTEMGVKIEFLVEGQFPGDGKPKPMAFPEPSEVGEDYDGICYLKLPTLIDLKLASGMTNITRTKDLGDVVELIKVLRLCRDLASQLHPYVRDKYLEFWDSIQKVQAESASDPHEGGTLT
jgi:hypothetical protein